MSTQIVYTYKEAQAQLDELCHNVIQSREIVLIEREDGENVALIAADELSSMKETIHLLSSRANASRLYDALEQAKAKVIKPQTINELFEELGIDANDEDEIDE
ncbi:type II toxin-antitoxin system Phd/YefM family antitoxin [Nostoc sp. FACHB-280]|uniref:type II toxin-antitoxin system Phd/YefM family antitoxin n=1 Tax=Nostoc sp. FACHB-280 TaxID=2692839 RepID=UPI00168A8D11|nr:type II toxin-antitoxin system Phd/YefM family antitoxin [Nostoc sp. FACHB-280]MBD2494455.1 type II toxin-antitoxin system Phd/YefM family antitoxin [Nostoc sp. FACHB-280]